MPFSSHRDNTNAEISTKSLLPLSWAHLPIQKGFLSSFALRMCTNNMAEGKKLRSTWFIKGRRDDLFEPLRSICGIAAVQSCCRKPGTATRAGTLKHRGGRRTASVGMCVSCMKLTTSMNTHQGACWSPCNKGQMTRCGD